MGLSLLTPLFLAGLGLLAAPFIIHQIRRPEREPIRFSSVMFIPNVEKEVIERKRIQHILLMLLRMLLLLLLAFAFARPYWKALAAGDDATELVRHVVLLDTSYSMGATGVFDDARRAARKVIGDIASDESVSVMTFAQTLEVVAPFESDSDSSAGSKDAARRAIDAAALSQGGTSYLTALELAQQRSVNPGAETEAIPGRLVFHVISDFQKQGMPQRATGWKLSPSVELELISVGDLDARNFAITDTHIRRSADGSVHVLGKIRNWSDEDEDALAVTLVMNGETIDQNAVTVRARSATQTTFRLEKPVTGNVEGYLELAGDDLATDNRRYFTWNPPRKTRILLVSEDRPGERWPSAWFFEQALPTAADSPWETDRATPGEVAEVLGNPARRPKVVVACDVEGTDPALMEQLLDFAETGGQVLFLVNASMDAEALNVTVFSGAPLEATEFRFRSIRETRFEPMSWVDLEHPVFAPFQGTRFNDFSALRFFNFMKLEASEGAKVLARMDDDSPAIVELSRGLGRVVVWPFALNLEWTNLPKNARFLPLLYETFSYLGGLEEGAVMWEVGERVPGTSLVLDDSGAGVIQLPNASDDVAVRLGDPETARLLLLEEPGFFRTKLANAAAWQQVDATNVDAAEGDLTPIDVGEFQMKVATTALARAERSEAGMIGSNVDADGFVIEKEYGRILLLLLFALALVESWYMSALKA